MHHKQSHKIILYNYFQTISFLFVHLVFHNPHFKIQGGKCNDVLAAKQCERSKSRGMCEKKLRWARKRCRKTCGLCDPLQTFKPLIHHVSTDLLVDKAEPTNQLTEDCKDVFAERQCKRSKARGWCEKRLTGRKVNVKTHVVYVAPFKLFPKRINPNWSPHQPLQVTMSNLIAIDLHYSF